MLATMLFAQGTPFLLAGDEFGNSQDGCENAWDQDNPVGWVDWAGLESDPEFTAQVRELIALRRRLPLLRRPDYVHDPEEVDWLGPDGGRMQAAEWREARAMTMLLGEGAGTGPRLAVLVNGAGRATAFDLPPGEWRLAFCSAELEGVNGGSDVTLPAQSIALLETTSSS